MRAMGAGIRFQNMGELDPSKSSASFWCSVFILHRDPGCALRCCVEVWDYSPSRAFDSMTCILHEHMLGIGVTETNSSFPSIRQFFASPALL